ncbi:MAG: pantoate--beta-alanine ligase [Rhodobiaceae bacterium]|nr:pantoate--beta-alanine ligase [Rhodobiaceae bacterium]MCC0017221.1 pantoate--beta-alanine ligase [Rhodobiaceae bacterium]MCC0041784.1 pantoate--beta-alanine ligase [Rhodobiaceae bacterium]MCC0052500.1 pantoate--beta-alanine ligase [Rhodobiaceae bacterium]
MARKPAIVHTVKSLRARVAAWRKAGEKVALVPTMGALHSGHLALVEEARRKARRVVVSIFVNPTQFAPSEDFTRYPRTLKDDVRKLADLDTDLVFAPDIPEMYPTGFCTKVTLGGPAEDLESVARPHFFGGVATVVCKLLLQCGADFAVFGEKDYQQLLVVRTMARDLDVPCVIHGLATIREADGLAMSSRNTYLSAEHRAVAPVLYRNLIDTAIHIREGSSIAWALREARSNLSMSGFRVDYFEARNAIDLSPINSLGDGPIRLLAAAWLGKTRLIDNIPV